MSEANIHSSTSDYFDEVLSFLKEFQWIFNYPNTEILVSGYLEQMPEEWLNFQKNLTYNDLKDLVLCNIREDYPESLKNFCNTARNLSKSQSQDSPLDSNHKLDNSCRLNAKKQHEIILLAPLIAEICRKTGTDEVVDIGAGLGYLPYLLSEKYNLSVCAIEGCPEKIHAAQKIQEKYHKTTINSVIFHHHFITENSLDTIEEILHKQFPKVGNKCVCGLHACADLSIVILEMFLRIEELKSLVIMPCCYHRLKLENTKNEAEYFPSFPKSELLKAKFEEFQAYKFCRRPFLRLACQQTKGSFIGMSEEGHKNHAKNFLMRALLEKGAHEVHCNITRLKRKTGSRDNNNFEEYLGNLHHNYKLVPRNEQIDEINIQDPTFRNKLSELWEQHKGDVFQMELITALQTTLQSICENILLLDRLQFLRENGVNCYIRKVTDDNISPRCYALARFQEYQH